MLQEVQELRKNKWTKRQVIVCTAADSVYVSYE